jgi:hypothetical protein
MRAFRLMGAPVAPEKLSLGQTYTLQEVSEPVTNVQPISLTFEMDKSHKELNIVNQVPPETPYGR